MKNTVIKYAVTAAVAGLCTLMIMFLHGFFDAKELVDKYRIVADAFTIPGVLLVMVCALMWISTTGFFDIISYAFSQTGGRLIPFFNKFYKHETYYDYKTRKGGDRVSGYGFLAVVGAVFIAISLVFVYLHSTVYVPLV